MAPSILLRKFFSHSRSNSVSSPTHNFAPAAMPPQSPLPSFDPNFDPKIRGHQSPRLNSPENIHQVRHHGNVKTASLPFEDLSQKRICTDLDKLSPGGDYNSVFSAQYASSTSTKPAPNFTQIPPTNQRSASANTPLTGAASKRKKSFLPSFRDRLNTVTSGEKSSSTNNNNNHSNVNNNQKNSSGNQQESNSALKHNSANSSKHFAEINRQQPREPRIGDIVYFGELKGIIRYIGTTHFAPQNAIFCGLELYTASGKNDGAVEGVRYFQCPFKFGLFVSVDRISFTPCKEPTSPSRKSSQNIAIPQQTNTNAVDLKTEVKQKTSSLRDHTSYFGSSYVRNDYPHIDCQNQIDSKSFSNGNLDKNTTSNAPTAINSLKAANRNAPKTPPSSNRKHFLPVHPQFLRTQSVPKLPTGDVINANNVPSTSNAISPMAREGPKIFESNQTSQTGVKNTGGSSNVEPASGMSKIERFLRPRNSRGNVSKVGTATGEGGAMGGSQRNSLTEVQMLLPKQNMSDLTLLIRDKQIQNGIPSTPLGDGSPGSALRQAQYLFTCPSPTPDMILGGGRDGGVQLEVATETYVIESEDMYYGGGNNSQTLTQVEHSPVQQQSEANFDQEPNLSSSNIFVNRISPEESNSDKMENFLETIPEAENSMANTLDRLGDRQSINSEESCCIPSRRTSPDGSCDNSLNNSNYASRNQILAQPIVVKSQFSDNFKLGALDEDLKGSKDTLSGDENIEDRCSELINLNQLKNVDKVKVKNNSVKTCFESKYDHACNNFYSPSPELPRSLTSSCNNLCDNDGDVSNYENEEEELNFDDNLLANRSAVFSSNQSELSDEDEEDPYCLLKEGAKRMEPDTISDDYLNSTRSSPFGANSEQKYSSWSSSQFVSEKEYEIVQDDIYSSNELILKQPSSDENLVCSPTEHDQNSFQTQYIDVPSLDSVTKVQQRQNAEKGKDCKFVKNYTKEKKLLNNESARMGMANAQIVVSNKEITVKNTDSGIEKFNNGRISAQENIDGGFCSEKRGTNVQAKQSNTVTSKANNSNSSSSSNSAQNSEHSGVSSALKPPSSYNNAKIIKTTTSDFQNKTTNNQEKSSSASTNCISASNIPVKNQGSPSHQKFGFIPKAQLANRELPPLPKSTNFQNKSNVESKSKRGQILPKENKSEQLNCQNKSEETVLSKAFELNQKSERNDQHYAYIAENTDKRYSELELPSPSLIFDQSNENSSNERDSGRKLTSNYHLSEDEKLGKTQLEDKVDEKVESQDELQDTDDEILRNDPAIVRIPKKKFSLPSLGLEGNKQSGLKSPLSIAPVDYIRSVSANQESTISATNQETLASTANQNQEIQLDEAMVVNSGMSKSGQKTSGVGGVKRLGGGGNSALPPPLPARHPKLANPKPIAVASSKSDQKQQVVTKVTSAANELVKSTNADLKASKIAQPRNLNSTAAQSQGIPKPGSKAEGGKKKSVQENKNGGKDTSQLPTKIQSGKPIPNKKESLNVDSSEEVGVNKPENLSILDLESIQKSPSLSSLSSIKSTDRSVSSAVSANSRKAAPPKSSKSIIPTATGGNENDVKKLAAPIALAARPLAVPDSPVMSRKKKAPIGQSKLAGTPNQKQQGVQRRNKEARSKEETELQQKETEVSRLSLQLEEKCEQLRRSTLALETSNQAVDVFSVLIQHMTQSMDAFSVPELKRELANLHAALEQSTDSIDAANNEIKQLKVQHVSKVDEIVTEHNRKIETVKNQLQLEFDDLAEELRSSHEEDKDFLITEQELQLSQLKESHQSELEEIVANQEAVIEQLEQQHKSELNLLNDQYTEDITSTQLISSQTIQKLRDQISELEERNGGLSRKVRELERYIELKTTGKGESWKKGFFEPEADGRERAKSVPDQPVSAEWMPEELQSLRCVLEMRDEEIHRLRREMNDANALRETLMQKEEELSSCRLHVESLQASLQMKSDMEKELRFKCNEQSLKLIEGRKERKKLSTENEKLSYQMRDMETMVHSFLEREKGDGQDDSCGFSASYTSSSEHHKTSSLPSEVSTSRPLSLAVNKLNQTFNGPISTHRETERSLSFSPQLESCESRSPNESSLNVTEISSANSEFNSLDRLGENKSSSSSCSEKDSQCGDKRKPRKQKSLAFTVPF